jgi:hypothetical protein
MAKPAMAAGVQLAEVGLSAGLLSFLAAYSRAHDVTLGPVIKNGELLGVPFSLAGAVLAGIGAFATKGNSHLMNIAVGGATAWLTTAGIKLGYRGTALMPQVQTAVGAANLGPGYPYANYGYGYYGVGATPETEAMFREAGIP